VNLQGAFFDELEKIAGKKLPLDLMRKALLHIHPYGWEANIAKDMEVPAKTIKEIYRSATRGSREFEVPIKERLRNFRDWKRTGTLNEVEHTWGGAKGDTPIFFRFDRSPRTRKAKYERSDAPMTIYSGGTHEGLSAAVKSPSTLLDKSFLRPGETKASTVGLFAGAPEEASHYVGRGPGEIPAIAKITVPKKYIFQSLERPESIIHPSAGGKMQAMYKTFF